VMLLMTSTVLMVSAEDETPVDDVDRTDFSDPTLNPDLDKVRLPTGPHSEVESASLLVDLANEGKVPVGTKSSLLVALANLGPKMFNVSAITGMLLSTDGKVVQKFAKKEYGDSLGPREQRSVLFGFMPHEETPLGAYKLEFKIFYNNRDKDQFVDTVYSETAELVPTPPSMDAKLRIIKTVGGSALLLVLLVLGMRLGGGKAKPSVEKPSSKAAGKAAARMGEDEWLSATLAGTENQSPKKKKEKRR